MEVLGGTVLYVCLYLVSQILYLPFHLLVFCICFVLHFLNALSCSVTQLMHLQLQL